MRYQLPPHLHIHTHTPLSHSSFLPCWQGGQTEHVRALFLPISLPANEAQPSLLPLPPIPPYLHTSTSPSPSLEAHVRVASLSPATPPLCSHTTTTPLGVIITQPAYKNPVAQARHPARCNTQYFFLFLEISSFSQSDIVFDLHHEAEIWTAESSCCGFSSDPHILGLLSLGTVTCCCVTGSPPSKRSGVTLPVSCLC